MRKGFFGKRVGKLLILFNWFIFGDGEIEVREVGIRSE